MGVPSSDLHSERGTDTYPLLMERSENVNVAEHVIDIQRSIDAASPISTHDRASNGSEVLHREERASSSTRASVPQPSASSSNETNSRNPSTVRRGDARRRRSPINSGLWISIELVLTVSQIVASIIVLALSKDEHPHAPLRAWIIGCASGCIATLPLLYWRYCHRSPGSDQESTQSRQTSQISVPAGPFSLSFTRTSEADDRRSSGTATRGGQNAVMRARVKVLVEYFKMALDFFFAVWFVVGNVWIFGGHSSASEAPNMYRLCIVFLTFSCIGYAMPFILCATICCCLPCIISILGFREDLAQTRGATPESIDALPTYKFKVKRSRSDEDRDINPAGEGGIVAAGTEKERVISGEDAVCCICLGKYANNDELKELPCSHFFHKDCVDKWLKINASCPLCKSEVGENLQDAQSGTSAAILASLSGGHDNSQRRSERRVGDGSTV